jgi:hypothetical protein
MERQMDDHKEEWTRLCQQAAVEQDPERLMKLVARIVELLDSRRANVSLTHSNPPAKPNLGSGNV